MLTDQNNHKAESIWAGMTPKLESFISQGVDHFYICSDSTSAQYRNSKNAYFMKDFATKHKVKIDWIFTERHHGKSPADGICGNVKNTVEQLTAFSTQHNIKNAEDVANLLWSTERGIENTFQIIPGDLTSLKGVTKFHEISVAVES